MHGTESHVNLALNRQIYSANGVPQGVVKGGYTTEYVLLGTALHDGRAQVDFCMPGDSGSLIFDSAGNCAGLMFGMLNGATSELNHWRQQYNRAGLVTTMSTVRESIRTKARLVRNVVGTDSEGRERVMVTPTGQDGVLRLGHL